MVNYRREQLRQVLKSEYPRGLDLVYESGEQPAGRGLAASCLPGF